MDSPRENYDFGTWEDGLAILNAMTSPSAQPPDAAADLSLSDMLIQEGLTVNAEDMENLEYLLASGGQESPGPQAEDFIFEGNVSPDLNTVENQDGFVASRGHPTVASHVDSVPRSWQMSSAGRQSMAEEMYIEDHQAKNSDEVMVEQSIPAPDFGLEIAERMANGSPTRFLALEFPSIPSPDGLMDPELEGAGESCDPNQEDLSLKENHQDLGFNSDVEPSRRGRAGDDDPGAEDLDHDPSIALVRAENLSKTDEPSTPGPQSGRADAQIAPVKGPVKKLVLSLGSSLAPELEQVRKQDDDTVPFVAGSETIRTRGNKRKYHETLSLSEPVVEKPHLRPGDLAGIREPYSSSIDNGLGLPSRKRIRTTRSKQADNDDSGEGDYTIKPVVPVGGRKNSKTASGKGRRISSSSLSPAPDTSDADAKNAQAVSILSTMSRKTDRIPRDSIAPRELASLKDGHGAKRVSTSPRKTRQAARMSSQAEQAPPKKRTSSRRVSK